MIYHAETKCGVLSFLRQIGWNTAEAYEDMTNMEQEDGTIDWVVIATECRVCGYRTLIICPLGSGIDRMECDRCQNAALERATQLEE